MASDTLLVALVERIAACQGGDTYFTANEVASWPADFTRAIESIGLLGNASPAQSVVCTGCEEACVMPVVVIHGATPRALIFCDKRDDIDRVEVPFGSMERRKSSGNMLAEVLAKLLQMSTSHLAQTDANYTRWEVGQLQGTKRKSPLVLALDLEPVLAVAGHTVKLVEVLAFKKGAVAIDLPALRKLVDNPTGQPAEASETPEERAQRFRAVRDRLKVGGVKAFQKEAAKEVGVSVQRFKQVLAAHPNTKAPAQWYDALASTEPSPSSKKSKR